MSTKNDDNSQSKTVTIGNHKFHKRLANPNRADCARRREKCYAKAALNENGEWEVEGVHECTIKTHNLQKENDARKEILNLCETTRRSYSEIFKEVCER